MTGELIVRQEGKAGILTLNRPKALNALTWEMVTEIHRALDAFAADAGVGVVIFEGAGDRAFCAGGDIADLYRHGTEGDHDYGRRFWREEYRMNARIAEFPKPVVAFLHGFVMGGGVGVACHASCRVAGESAKIAMPECAIGLVPDVGGSLLLARAPGRLGEYLGTTGFRMGPGDAILAGFADRHVPEADWPALKAELAEAGSAAPVDARAVAPPEGKLPALRAPIDRHFAGETLGDILGSLRAGAGAFESGTLETLAAFSPLSMACTVEMVRRNRAGAAGIRDALALEFRFTARATETADFLEGIRAALIDRDKAPRWRHAPGGVGPEEVAAMLAPLESPLALGPQDGREREGQGGTP
jgi:enoyl-CoA hydratase/carnithine racemase